MATKELVRMTRQYVNRLLYGNNNGQQLTKKADLSVSIPCQKSSSGFRSKELIDNLRHVFNTNFTLVSVLFARQCNIIAALRIRRTVQIASLYRRLGYEDQNLFRRVVETLRSSASFLKIRPHKHHCLLLGASLFSWEKDQISEEDIKDCLSDVHKIHDEGTRYSRLPREGMEDCWQIIVNRDNLVIWRKPLNDTLYEYKVFGTFRDIPARAFFDVQVDLDFRRQWDRLIVHLDVVDKDLESGCEVVRWVTHFPYPMYSREYVYIRKNWVDTDKKLMVMMSQSTDHPCCPESKKYVRVSSYMSHMVIKPHSNFDENGFDYILSYYDDPKAALPSPAYNWVASTGVPDFLDKVHDAAQQLNERKRTTVTLAPPSPQQAFGAKQGTAVM